MTSDLGVIAFFFKEVTHHPNVCVCIPGRNYKGQLLFHQIEVPGHTQPRKSVPGLFLEICFSCSTFFPLSNARNREGHRADYIGYTQAAFRLPSRTLSVQFRPDHNSPELNLSFTLSFLSMKNIYWGLS